MNNQEILVIKNIEKLHNKTDIADDFHQKEILQSLTGATE